MNRNVVAILVNNHFGVLNRISGMFRRRGFNIDSLTVGATQDPEISRITITFMGDENKTQIIRQLEKMPDVMEVAELDSDNSVSRELVLIKIANSSETRQDVLAIVDAFRAKVVDYAVQTMTIEVTGESSKIDAIIELLKEFGIIEMCRTGLVALSRSNGNVLDGNSNT